MSKDKEIKLRCILREMTGALLAYSGGVDSSYLLKIASEELGEKLLAVTALSATYPERERRQALEFAAGLGCRHRTVVSEELDIPEFAENPANRCYFCKKELFGKLKQLAAEEGLAQVIEGSNVDDDQDYRPGRQAVAELGIRSPLKEAGLTKEEIRTLAKQSGVPHWNKTAQACLSSRFPYGEKITREGLKQVEEAENILWQAGFTQARVRRHGELARIEVPAEEMPRLLQNAGEIYERFNQLGFVFVTADLRGYRCGSMNETLPKK